MSLLTLGAAAALLLFAGRPSAQDDEDAPAPTVVSPRIEGRIDAHGPLEQRIVAIPYPLAYFAQDLQRVGYGYEEVRGAFEAVRQGRVQLRYALGQADFVKVWGWDSDRKRNRTMRYNRVMHFEDLSHYESPSTTGNPWGDSKWVYRVGNTVNVFIKGKASKTGSGRVETWSREWFDGVLGEIGRAEADPHARLASMREHAKAQAVSAGGFGAAFLLKESVREVMQHGPSADLRRVALDLASPQLWGSVGLFAAAASGTEHALAGRLVHPRQARPGVSLTSRGQWRPTTTVVVLGRTTWLRRTAANTLPLAAGLGAVELVLGDRDPLQWAIATGSFSLAAPAVDQAAHRLFMTMPFARHNWPPGAIILTSFTIAKLAATLYVGESIEEAAREAIAQARR